VCEFSLSLSLSYYYYYWITGVGEIQGRPPRGVLSQFGCAAMLLEVGLDRSSSIELIRQGSTFRSVDEMAGRVRTPSEFGGEPGRVQRGTDGFTHELTPAEEARLARATEPTDPADDANAALIREWEAEGRG
jgi:hypothetical protein